MQMTLKAEGNWCTVFAIYKLQKTKILQIPLNFSPYFNLHTRMCA